MCFISYLLHLGKVDDDDIEDGGLPGSLGVSLKGKAKAPFKKRSQEVRR